MDEILKKKRGFASMDPERQKEIARQGGKKAHEKGTAHEFTKLEAREAGRKGGEKVSRDRDHMAQIGRAGGQARARGKALNRQIPNQPETYGQGVIMLTPSVATPEKEGQKAA